MALIDGKKIADEIQEGLKKKIAEIEGRKPSLAVILVGTNPASQVYVKNKTKACEYVGITSETKNFPDTITQEQLIKEVRDLNKDPSVDGILVQLPLPSHIDAFLINRTIAPEKDVDGFNPTNLGKLLVGETDGFVPCTPLGIKMLLDYYKVEVAGKHAVIIGRSNIVGKPMGALLIQNTPGANATVTMIHRHTKNVAEICRMADILIVAMGQPLFVKESMVKEGVVVIDVGMNRIQDPNKLNGFKFVGDVDFENVKDKCSLITPVPRGVGPMTIAMLLTNTLSSYYKQINLPDKF